MLARCVPLVDIPSNKASFPQQYSKLTSSVFFQREKKPNPFPTGIKVKFLMYGGVCQKVCEIVSRNVFFGETPLDKLNHRRPT